jgi:hypothetical protein
MIPQSNFAMPPRSDIIAYSMDHRPVLVVECKGGKGTSPENAALLRRNLLAHELIPDAPYFLLAFATAFFLWREKTPADELPDFSASARSVLREYLGELAEKAPATRGESLQLALVSWLGDLASAIRQPDPGSEADQMLVKSGVYEKIRRGEVKSEVAMIKGYRDEFAIVGRQLTS